MATGSVGRLEGRLVRRFEADTGIDVRLDLDLRPPRVGVVFGPSGAGKTTLLRCVAGLERLDEGRLMFDRTVWEDVSKRRRVPPQRRSLSFLHQHDSLFPHLSVSDNIGFGLRRQGAAGRRSRVGELLERLEIEGLGSRFPAELSGGQRQRVSLARALAPQPPLLLLDEPFSSLDRPARRRLLSFLGGVLEAEASLTLLVTHDWEEALSLGDELLVMHGGRILQQGSPSEVFARPVDLEVAEAVGVETVVAGRVVRRVNDLVEVSVGSTSVWASGRQTAGTCYCSIRASDVVLEVGRAEQSSARNHLRGHVLSVSPQGELFRVEVDVGFRLAALVTGASRLELGLETGRPVRAVIKASAIHLIEARQLSADTG